MAPPTLRPIPRAEWDGEWDLRSDMVRFYPSGVHRRRLIASWLEPLSPRSVLDAGCGPGHLLATLRERLPGATLCGADWSDRTVDEDSRRIPWARFEHLDLGAERLDEQF